MSDFLAFSDGQAGKLDEVVVVMMNQGRQMPWHASNEFVRQLPAAFLRNAHVAVQLVCHCWNSKRVLLYNYSTTTTEVISLYSCDMRPIRGQQEG